LLPFLTRSNLIAQPAEGLEFICDLCFAIHWRSAGGISAPSVNFGLRKNIARPLNSVYSNYDRDATQVAGFVGAALFWGAAVCPAQDHTGYCSEDAVLE
jgi:hypothetical protein